MKAGAGMGSHRIRSPRTPASPSNLVSASALAAADAVPEPARDRDVDSSKCRGGHMRLAFPSMAAPRQGGRSDAPAGFIGAPGLSAGAGSAVACAWPWPLACLFLFVCHEHESLLDLLVVT